MFSIKLSLILYICIVFKTAYINSLAISAPENCTQLENCPDLLELIRSKRDHFGTGALLTALHCHNNGRQAFTRCISSSKIKEFMDRASLLPDQEDCGAEGLRPKIAGGDFTQLDEFPWIALLRYRNETGSLNYGCHANLISKKYLVTAAHCVKINSDKIANQLIGKAYSVILGEYDIRNNTDCIYSKYGTECADEIKEYLIESYNVHPEYDPNSKKNDIALIRMKEEVEFSDFIKPICLPPNVLMLTHNETWWIGGWGETQQYKMNSIKMKAKFNYKANDDCFVNVNLTEHNICAGSSQNAKTCPGDSGGPLMMQRIIGQNYRTFLIGVTSLGADCNKDLYLTIFTKISVYLDWIINNLRP